MKSQKSIKIYWWEWTSLTWPDPILHGAREKGSGTWP